MWAAKSSLVGAEAPMAAGGRLALRVPVGDPIAFAMPGFRVIRTALAGRKRDCAPLLMPRKPGGPDGPRPAFEGANP